jgi:hypothetical protein
LALLLFLTTCCAVAQTVRQWEPFELTITGSAELPNAFVDGLPDGGKPFVEVTFTGTTRVSQRGMRAGPGMARIRSRHEDRNARRPLLRICDGTPFLWIGETWWPWLKRGIPFTRARQVIDDRAARGFTDDFENSAMTLPDYRADYLAASASMAMPVLNFYGRTDWSVGPGDNKLCRNFGEFPGRGALSP